MTHQRFDIDPLDATAKAVQTYPGKTGAMALRIAMSQQVLRNKLSPTVHTHHLTLDEFGEIVDKLFEVDSPMAMLPIQAMCYRHNCVAVRMPDVDADGEELLMLVMEILSEEGQLADHLRRSLDGDHTISDRELGVIEEDIKRVLESLITLRDKARAKNAADFHQGRK